MELLLPYANDCNGNLVHIRDAQKGQKYTCPCCGARLSLRISKIPKGQKWHRRSHFAHKGGVSINYCSGESVIHKCFKEACANLIRTKILNKEKIYIVWLCDKCHEVHRINILENVKNVITEHNLGICKPDIALLDNNNNTIVAIEIIFTHDTESNVLEYYKNNNIICLRINIHTEEFFDKDILNNIQAIEAKITRANANIRPCSNPICTKCGGALNSIKLITGYAVCEKCGMSTKIALRTFQQKIQGPAYFNEEEILKAKEIGANLTLATAPFFNGPYQYLDNTCKYCNKCFTKDFLLNPSFSEGKIIIMERLHCVQCMGACLPNLTWPE